MTKTIEPKVQEMNLIWKHTHPDYRGKIDGVRYVLVGRRGSGTCSVPLQSLTAEEHAEMLKYAKGCQERGRKGY